MSEISTILWWMVLGAIAIVSSVLLMALIGVVKHKEWVGFLPFLSSARNGFKEVARESVEEIGIVNAFANTMLTCLLWPFSVYKILNGKYSWN